MPELVHEIWIDSEGLESCILAGDLGKSARKMEHSDSKIVHRFKAKSHFEAMCIYHKYLSREPYKTEFESDHEEYSEEWLTIQNSSM